MRGRKSLREIYADTNKADAFYAAMHGVAPQNQAEIRAPRKRAAPGADGMPLEADIQKAILGYLQLCPKVAFALRVNSGTFVERGDDGKERYIQANRLIKIKGRVVDVVGMLTDSRFFAVEVKRPGWTRPRNEREEDQEKFINAVKANGGIGLFATSVDDVIARIA
jgi:hypothetical protein